jgi:hypothetical protein
MKKICKYTWMMFYNDPSKLLYQSAPIYNLRIVLRFLVENWQNFGGINIDEIPTRFKLRRDF